MRNYRGLFFTILVGIMFKMPSHPVTRYRADSYAYLWKSTSNGASISTKDVFIPKKLTIDNVIPHT